jgi:hypothetical protein
MLTNLIRRACSSSNEPKAKLIAAAQSVQELQTLLPQVESEHIPDAVESLNSI